MTKLLIVTQKVDRYDFALGFFHRWIEEFAKHCEKVTVICLEKGGYDLPHNVTVLSLGKEEGKSVFKYVFRFYKYIWQERKNYDLVFVHMNPEYVVLGALPWRLWGKRVTLWYVHRGRNLKLKIAEMFSNRIFTSSVESFRFKSRKVMYVGHGIDSKFFQEVSRYSRKGLVYVGRITRIKNIDTIIHALRELKEKGVEESLKIVGISVTEQDKKYRKELDVLAKELGVANQITWMGSRSHFEIPCLYQQAKASINASPTGGMDKAVLESWASQCPAFVSNEAFQKIEPTFIFPFKNYHILAQKIFEFLNNSEEKAKFMTREISDKIGREYSLSSLISTIITS